MYLCSPCTDASNYFFFCNPTYYFRVFVVYVLMKYINFVAFPQHSEWFFLINAFSKRYFLKIGRIPDERPSNYSCKYGLNEIHLQKSHNFNLFQ